MSAVAESVPINIIQHREYTDVTLPNGEQARKYLASFVQQYLYTLEAPPFVMAYRLEALAQKLNSEGLAYSNPRRIIEHPAFLEIQRFGRSSIPYLLGWLERDPYVWLIVLPVLAGSSPVQPQHRGRTRDMVEDWKQWGVAQGYTR
jgi:hypothetical protein